MTSGRWSYSGERVQVPSLPLSVDLWREEIEDYNQKVYSGRISTHKRQELERTLRKAYRHDSPLREYIGFTIDRDELERVGWTDAESIQFRVMARSGFEGKKAVEAHLGQNVAVSVWNEEDARRLR